MADDLYSFDQNLWPTHLSLKQTRRGVELVLQMKLGMTQTIQQTEKKIR